MMSTEHGRSRSEPDAPEHRPGDPPADQAPRTPADRGGALPPGESSDDVVEDALEESFPASDPPTYSRIT